MVNHERHVTKIIKLDLKTLILGSSLYDYSGSYKRAAIKELQQLETLQMKFNQIMPPIKRLYLTEYSSIY